MAGDKARERRRRSAITDVLEDLPRQIAALDHSYRGFDDHAGFLKAFGSDEPAVYGQVLVLERAFGRIQNHIADLARDGALLAGVPLRQPKDNEPKAQPAWEALRDAGVIGADMTKRFVARQKIRASLEHQYAQVSPGRLYRVAGELLDDAPPFADLYAAWITPFLLDA